MQPNPQPNQVHGHGDRLRAVELSLARLRGTDGPSVLPVEAGHPSDLHALARTLTEHAHVVARPLRLTPEGIRDVALAGGTLLAPVDGGWMVIDRRRCTLVNEARERSFGLTERRLARLMGAPTIEAVVVEPQFGMALLSERSIGSRNPFARLRRLVVLEGHEIAALVVFAVVIGGLSLAVPVAVQVLVNTIAFGNLLQPLVILAMLLSGVLVLSGSVQIAQWYAMEILQRRIFVRVSEDFSRRLAAARFELRDRIDLRELSNRFFDVVSLQKTMSQLMLDGLGLALQTAVGLLLMAFYHPVLLAFDVALIVSLGIVVGVGFGAVPTALNESVAKYRVAAWIQNIASNLGVFKHHNAAVEAARKSDVLTRAWVGARRRHYRKVLRHLVGGMGVQIVALVALLGLGGWLVMQGELTLGQLVAAELVVGVIGAGFAKIGKHLEASYDLLASLDKIGMVLDLPVDDEDLIESPDDGPFGLELIEVEIGRETWRHAERLNLRVAGGSRMQLVGRGGCGKSTLLETMAGLRAPTEGRIRLRNARMASGVARRLRRDTYLLNTADAVEGTILDNLRLGRPDLDEEGAWALLSEVGLCDVVRRYPEGLEAHLMGSGAPLSSSERARLALARAFAARPSLLLIDGVLDELGLSDDAFDAVLARTLGPSAPWGVVAVSRDSRVTRFLDERVSLGDEGGPSW